MPNEEWENIEDNFYSNSNTPLSYLWLKIDCLNFEQSITKGTNDIQHNH